MDVLLNFLLANPGYKISFEQDFMNLGFRITLIKNHDRYNQIIRWSYISNPHENLSEIFDMILEEGKFLLEGGERS